jgi:hypothetical protein
MGKALATLGLMGIMALAGCESYQPVRNPQTGEVTYQKRFDAGRTLRAVGTGVLGGIGEAGRAGKIVDYEAAQNAALMARGLQGAGNLAREQEHQNQMYAQNNLPYPSQNYFFTCNRWVDLNQDGFTVMDEFFGIQSEFARGERVEVVALVNSRAGSELNFKLFNGGGEMLWGTTYVLPYATTFKRYIWDGDLMPGDYTSIWSIGEQTIGRSDFRVR